MALASLHSRDDVAKHAVPVMFVTWEKIMIFHVGGDNENTGHDATPQQNISVKGQHASFQSLNETKLRNTCEQVIKRDAAQDVLDIPV